jgi:Na+-transporting NADH:ubiquinone oxidoreductase subunit NqrF
VTATSADAEAAPTASDNGVPENPRPARVDLVFDPGGRVRVPPGVTLFDAASWHGIAIDSTCGGHGTCKKCKVRVADGETAVAPLDARA